MPSIAVNTIPAANALIGDKNDVSLKRTLIPIIKKVKEKKWSKKCWINANE